MHTLRMALLAAAMLVAGVNHADEQPHTLENETEMAHRHDRRNDE
jgi:hypothetical protein